MHNTSKGYRRFKSRIEYFQDDLETIAVILKNKEILAGEDKIFKSVSETRQPRLFKRQNSPGSREVVLRHMQNSFFVSVIKDMYEEVLMYCEYATDCAAQTSTEVNRLVGEQNLNFSANDILSKVGKKEIVSMVMSRIFRAIENKKNTLLLVSFLNDRLNLGVSEDIINEAMPYLEARHKFIHADGLADEKYKSYFPNIELTDDGYIKLNITVIRKAMTAIKKLVYEYEIKMKANNLFPSNEYE